MSSSPELHALEMAHCLLKVPDTLTRGALARDANDIPCGPWDVCAVQYCLFGAILAAAFRLTGRTCSAVRLAETTAALLAPKLPRRDPRHNPVQAVVAFADASESAEMLALLDDCVNGR
jgi:hypothetical protein